MAKTGYGNFVLKFVSPWRGTTHQWSVASSHSGSAFTTESDQIAFLQSVAEQIMAYIASNSSTYLSEVLYYDGVQSTPKYSASYVSRAAGNTAGYLTSWYGAAYQEPAGTVQATTMAPYEACCILQAPIGFSRTGKPVVMKKFIHSCAAPANEIDELPFITTNFSNYAEALGSGALYESRVLISPKGAQGTWSALSYYGNHQAMRRRKKKTS